LAGELLIQVIDIARFQAIRPALSEVEAVRTLGSETRAVLREAAASPLVRRNRYRRFTGLLNRILRHPELELRVFLAPSEVDTVIADLVHVLCFENGAEFSLTAPVGPNWVVLNGTLAMFIELSWFREIFLDGSRGSGRLPYPRRGEVRYYILGREGVTRLAAGLRPLLEEPAAAPEKRSAAEGLAHLAAQALSVENLTLVHTSLL
jgi:hypothetical protein